MNNDETEEVISNDVLEVNPIIYETQNTRCDIEEMLGANL